MTMKTIFIKILIAIIIVIAPLVGFAQTPPHPNGGYNPGADNGPVGGGASVGSGLLILIGMGMTYTARKYYKNKNETPISE
jgi:hypothetical protein